MKHTFTLNGQLVQDTIALLKQVQGSVYPEATSPQDRGEYGLLSVEMVGNYYNNSSAVTVTIGESLKNALSTQASVPAPKDFSELDAHLQEMERIKKALGREYEYSKQVIQRHFSERLMSVYGANSAQAEEAIFRVAESKDPVEALKKYVAEQDLNKSQNFGFGRFLGKESLSVKEKHTQIDNVLATLEAKKIDPKTTEGSFLFVLEAFKTMPDAFAEVKGKDGFRFLPSTKERQVALLVAKNFDTDDKELQQSLVITAANYDAVLCAESQIQNAEAAIRQMGSQELLNQLQVKQNAIIAVAAAIGREDRNTITTRPFKQYDLPEAEALYETVAIDNSNPQEIATQALSEAHTAWARQEWATSVTEGHQDVATGLKALRQEMLNAFREAHGPEKGKAVFSVVDAIKERYGAEVYDAVLVQAILEASANGDGLPGGDRAEEIVSQDGLGKTYVHYERLSGVKGKYLAPMLLDTAFSAIAKTPYGAAVDKTSLATVAHELETDTYPDEKLRDSVMAINLEPESFADPEFFTVENNKVSGVLADQLYHLSEKGIAHRLVLEITERGQVDFLKLKALSVFRNTLKRTNGNSFLIAVDDANVVEADLERLAALRPNMLKTEAHLMSGWGKPPLEEGGVLERLDKLITLKRLADQTGTSFVAEKVPEVAGEAKIPVADILIMNGVGAQGFDVMDKIRGIPARGDKPAQEGDPHYYDEDRINERVNQWLENTYENNPQLADKVADFMNIERKKRDIRKGPATHAEIIPIERGR